MSHFDAFTHPAKENRVVADNVSGTNCLNSNLTLLPFPDETLSGIDTNLIEFAVHSFRQNLRNLERRSTRCILFLTMMRFNHLNIVIVSQRFRHLADDFVDKIDTHAHVGGQDAGDLRRERFELFKLSRRKPRRADYHGSSMLCHRTQVLKGGFRRRKVDEPLSSVKKRL